MTDNIPKAQRSLVMAAVRSKNTRPELIVRSMLHRLGYRFRLHRVDLPGKPDICLPKYQTVIFVHGCFWHGHKCPQARRPATNVKYWEEKILGNARRDKSAASRLRRLGWRRLVIWECQLRHPEVVQQYLVSALQMI